MAESINDLTIEGLSACYKESVRIVMESNRDATLFKSSENPTERAKYEDCIELSKEFTKCSMIINEAIKDKIREICGEN